jgi:membrane-associated progesterone receptor component
MRDMTMEELAEGDGKDPAKPIYIAIRGIVYDVSTGRQFYGPDGGCGAACCCVV